MTKRKKYKSYKDMTRKIGGRTFKPLLPYNLKSKAQERAKSIRKKGRRARVIKGKSVVTGKTIWTLWAEKR